MYPGPVVDDLDVLEQIQCGLLSGGVGQRVHALGPHDAHERLHGLRCPTARRSSPSGAHASLGQVSPGQCHSQGLVGELGRDVRAHRPSYDAPRPDVHHERQVQPALAGLDVGDVGEPRHVGAENDIRAGHIHRHSRLPKPRQASLVLRASAAQPAVRHVDIVGVRVAAGQQEARTCSCSRATAWRAAATDGATTTRAAATGGCRTARPRRPWRGSGPR